MIAPDQRRHRLSAALAPPCCLLDHLPGCLLGCLLVFSPALSAQPAQPAPAQPAPAQPAPTKPAPTQSAQAVPSPRQILPPSQQAAAPIPTEDALRRQLIGKTWYLRGLELGDTLRFSMRGQPLDHVETGSYTLCLVRIDKVQLTHKRLELEGARYALHFLGALPYEDPQKSVEEIRITPRKKLLRITIEREPVVKPKKSRTDKKHPTPTRPAETAANGADAHGAETDGTAANHAGTADTTDSPAVAAQTLSHALERILAPSLDAPMLASLPDDWQLYYAAQRSGHAFAPGGDVLPSSAVERSARLLKVIDPASNSFAQTNGIAGRALYRVVVSADGRPERIAILRPIGFGLDENAVAAIQSASFAPAVQSGHPVAESLDLGVMFRIYSKRTDVTNKADAGKATPGPSLPGPYSVK